MVMSNVFFSWIEKENRSLQTVLVNLTSDHRECRGKKTTVLRRERKIDLGTGDYHFVFLCH